MSQLPDFLQPYFWEVDFAQLRLPDREVYVIERVLEYGGDQAIRWLKETFLPEKLADVVRRSRRLSPNTANACLGLLRGRRGRRNAAHARSFRVGRC